MENLITPGMEINDIILSFKKILTISIHTLDMRRLSRVVDADARYKEAYMRRCQSYLENLGFLKRKLVQQGAKMVHVQTSMPRNERSDGFDIMARFKIPNNHMDQKVSFVVKDNHWFVTADSLPNLDEILG